MQKKSLLLVILIHFSFLYTAQKNVSPYVVHTAIKSYTFNNLHLLIDTSSLENLNATDRYGNNTLALLCEAYRTVESYVRSLRMVHNDLGNTVTVCNQKGDIQKIVEIKRECMQKEIQYCHNQIDYATTVGLYDETVNKKKINYQWMSFSYQDYCLTTAAACIKKLMLKNVSLEMKYEGPTLIHKYLYACYKNYYLVDLLLESQQAQKCMSMRDIHGNNPHHLFFMTIPAYGSVYKEKYIIQVNEKLCRLNSRIAEKNNFGNTIFHIAAASPITCADVLIKRLFSLPSIQEVVTMTDRQQNSLVDLARMNPSLEVRVILFQAINEYQIAHGIGFDADEPVEDFSLEQSYPVLFLNKYAYS